MILEETLNKLKDDTHYYGDFGKQFLSNSDIKVLLTNPLSLHDKQDMNINFLVGGYFHTCILEPDKLKKYKVIESSTRNTKKYKEISGGEMCLLQHEVDKIDLMAEKLLNNYVCRDLIQIQHDDKSILYEAPAVKQIGNNWWKGKADIINHNEKLVIDLKTTSSLDSFRYNSIKYNYDSQAYIYNKLFGYDMLFIVIDKNTHQIGLFDCSDEFYSKGELKVSKANDVYDLFYKTEGFDPKQFFISKTL